MSQIVQCQKCDKKTECRNYLEMAILCEKCIKSIEDKYAVKKAKENLAKSKKLSKSTKSEDKNAGKKLEAKTKRSFKKKMNKSKEIKEKKERTTIYVVGTSAKVKAKTKKVQARKTRYANRQNNLDKKKLIEYCAFIGALTFAVTDSHWFNAVESEVYSLSTFFTANVNISANSPASLTIGCVTLTFLLISVSSILQ